MPPHVNGYPHQDIYRITSCLGKDARTGRLSERRRGKEVIQSHSSPTSASPCASISRHNRLVDKQVYTSASPSYREKRTPKSSPGSLNWLRKSFGSLVPLWKALDIPPLERSYAGTVLMSHPEYLEIYTLKLKTLIELQSAYIDLSHDRQGTVRSVRQILSAGKGSKSVLVHSLTKLKRLTIFISTIVNLARIICKKPIDLQPFGISSASPKFNWLLYLKMEGLYNMENTALLFTIFCFVPNYAYKDHFHLVKEYFYQALNQDPDDHFVIKTDNHLNKDVETTSEDVQLSNYNSDELNEVSLNFLLGLQAETIFEQDCLATNWDAFLHTKQGVYNGDVSLPYTLLSPEQILDAVKNEEQTLIEFSSVLSDIRLSGCNVPLVPVVPDSPNIEVYTDKSTDIEDDNILLAEATLRQARASASRSISLNIIGLEPTARPVVPPCSIRESKDVSIDKDETENEADNHTEQTFADQSTLTTLVTALEMTERATTLTLDSTTIS